ncbi:MAG: hypothetical protein AB7I24_02110 [Candidatus Nanopelagicales bacterium]
MVQRRTLDRVQALGPGPWTRAELLGAGWGPQQIDRAVASGAVCRIRRGLYDVPSQPRRAGEPEDPSHLRALMGRLDPRAAASHETAGRLQRLWVPWPERLGVQVTVAGQAERSDGGLTVHGSRLPERFVEVVDGIRVTTPARTAMDLGRGRSLPAAMMAIDGAARNLLGASDGRVATAIRRRELPHSAYADVRETLEDAFTAVWSWPGTRVLRQALDLLECASESPLESWSRGQFLLAGLPVPLVGWPVQGASGRRYYVDFLWKDARLIGEADGLEKYGVTAEEQRRRYREQRERQDDLEAAGWRFVRWVTGEPAGVVLNRAARALGVPARHARRPPTRE